jgi:hypothetical protein
MLWHNSNIEKYTLCFFITWFLFNVLSNTHKLRHDIINTIQSKRITLLVVTQSLLYLASTAINKYINLNSRYSFMDSLNYQCSV